MRRWHWRCQGAESEEAGKLKLGDSFGITPDIIHDQNAKVGGHNRTCVCV